MGGPEKPIHVLYGLEKEARANLTRRNALKTSFERMVFNGVFSEICKVMRKTQPEDAEEIGTYFSFFSAVFDFFKTVNLAGLGDVPEDESERTKNADALLKEISDAHSKLKKNEWLKKPYVCEVFLVIRKFCSGKDYSPDAVAYLFFAKKFYEPILNVFHLK